MSFEYDARLVGKICSLYEQSARKDLDLFIAQADKVSRFVLDGAGTPRQQELVHAVMHNQNPIIQDALDGLHVLLKLDQEKKNGG